MKPLNPIMAVLAIASVGVFPLRALAADGKAPAVVVKTPDGVAVAAADTNSITKLTEILNKNSKAKDDVGQRVTDFLLKPDAAKKSFVAADVDAAALAAVAKEWTKKQTPGSLAMLYFVVGVGPTPPDWVKNDDFLKKTVLPEREAEGRLRTALSGYTDPGGQIKKTREKDASVTFLNAAVVEAKKIFDDPRPKKVVNTDINQNDNTGANPPDGTRGAGSRLNGASQQYTMKDLYLDGAVFGDVSGPKDEHSRKISMKIYTKRNADGSTTNEIGIFDITDEGNIYGRRFPVGGGDQSFVLDDRTPGHKKYELKFETLPGGDRKVVFTRPGGGVPLETKVSDLYLKRADQAANLSNIINVGGQEFYVLPQGGRLGAVAMFPKALIDSRGTPGLDPRRLKPELYAEIGRRGSEGLPENLPGKPHLGAIGGKEFHLEFNQELGVWEVKDGPGDKPAAPTTGDGTAPGGTPGGTPGETPAPKPGGMTLAELLLTFKDSLASGICKINPDDTKDLAKDLKDRYAILACTYDQRGGLKQVVLVPKSEVHPGQQLEYGSVSGFKLLRARFFDHYLILEFDKQVQYFDLLSYDTDANKKPTGFAVSGFVMNGKAVQFTHTDPFVHALKTYMKNVPAEALTEVPKRVKAVQGSKPYYVSGEFPKDVFIVMVTSDGVPYMVWPKLEKPGEAPKPAPDPYTTINGPTNAFDGSVASDDASFPPDIKLPESRKALPIKTQPDIVLYESDDAPKKYFIMFRYKGLTPKVPSQQDGEQVVTTFRQKQLETFNASNPYPGNSLRMGGLMAGPVVKDRVASGYKFISGSTKEKGVMAMFQNKQVSATNAKEGEANCVGPVLWWGLSDVAALKACQEDKF